MTTRALLLHAAAVVLVLFVAAVTRAETFSIQLKTQERTPMVGETLELYLVAPFTAIAVAVTDAGGNVTFTDNVFVGQNRCHLIRAKTGWSFKGTGINDVAPILGSSGNSSPFCVNNFDAMHYFWGERVVPDKINIIGGQRGYVNPDRNETAIIVVIPLLVADMVTVKIYTSRGKLVATKVKMMLPNIKNEIVWDARNSDGRMVSSGIYIAHVSGAGINTTRKIAIVRN
jgi:hypothetical protein